MNFCNDNSVKIFPFIKSLSYSLSMCGCLSCTPYWGAGLQPKHMPWLGVELVTLWFTAHTQSTKLHQPDFIKQFKKTSPLHEKGAFSLPAPIPEAAVHKVCPQRGGSTSPLSSPWAGALRDHWGTALATARRSKYPEDRRHWRMISCCPALAPDTTVSVLTAVATNGHLFVVPCF